MVEFSLAGYRQLLTTFKDAGYAFVSFAESEQYLAAGKPFVILRHDIDISLRPALEFARVEHELGVAATYFVLLRSPFYNLLSRPGAKLMEQLHDCGHHLALHVDLAAYDGDCAEALLEIEVLSGFYPFVDTRIASLHSPCDISKIPMELFQPINAVYGLSLRRDDIAYISDSTGRWLYGHPLDSPAFYTRKPIQLLTHPIWWVQDAETATAKLEQWFYNDYLYDCKVVREFMPKLFSFSVSERKS